MVDGGLDEDWDEDWDGMNDSAAAQCTRFTGLDASPESTGDDTTTRKGSRERASIDIRLEAYTTTEPP